MKIYLQNVNFSAKNTSKTEFPFILPLFQKDWDLKFTTPITFILGDNGTGKSTLLESLANNIGFNILGGSENHCYENDEVFDSGLLSNYIKLTWREKKKKGFFFRAENFLNFSLYIDEIAKE
ncbi:MAG: AAA family ATPase, partial [Clostridia bacterium]|nr:AAA family ATPase [Clostridia bacterium]